MTGTNRDDSKGGNALGAPNSTANRESYRPPSYRTVDAEAAKEWKERFGKQYDNRYDPHSYDGAQSGPRYEVPIVSQKDHVVAGLLAIFLGSLGVHKFYLGYNDAGFIMLAVTVIGSLLTLGIAGAVMGVIGFIEGIIYLTKSQTEFDRIYVFGTKEWF